MARPARARLARSPWEPEMTLFSASIAFDRVALVEAPSEAASQPAPPVRCEAAPSALMFARAPGRSPLPRAARARSSDSYVEPAGREPLTGAPRWAATCANAL